jgi:hypothetical protein
MTEMDDMALGFLVWFGIFGLMLLGAVTGQTWLIGIPIIGFMGAVIYGIGYAMFGGD